MIDTENEENISESTLTRQTVRFAERCWRNRSRL